MIKEYDEKQNEKREEMLKIKNLKKMEREEKKKEREEKKKEIQEKKEFDDEIKEMDDGIKEMDDGIKEMDDNSNKNNDIIFPRQKLPDKNIILSNELDVLDEFYEMNTNKHIYTEKKEINYENATIYPSPVPLERHFSSLDNADPNPAILPVLLFGKVIENQYKPIEIFHGPPGTGKTYTLIKELDKLLSITSKGKILVCAPSNIGVINLYNRALSFNIKGRIILSNSKSNIYNELPEIDEKNINKRVYFSTISMRYGKSLKDIDFNTIFIDEAAQCQEALIWGLLKRSVNKLYMSGDPYQLPALVSDEGKKYNFDRSLMQRLMEIDYPTNFLDIQRRMHPKIAEFSNINYYDNRLKTEYNYNFDTEPIIIVNVNGEETKIETSYNNTKENKKVIETVNNLKNLFDDIVIISPYNAQCDALKKMDSNLKVFTLDSFQGKEADAVILTTVRTGNTVGFWEDFRRLNVGMTRARHALRIIGKTSTWTLTNNPLKKLFNFALDNKIPIM